MKKLYLGLAIALTLIIFVAGFWISAYNGSVTTRIDIDEKQGNVYASLSTRYDKMEVMIDAIESANTTVLGYLNTIKDARIAFADAIANEDLDAANTSIDEINSTFINLISFVEDNPSSYNTTGLYANALAEFNASTNVVLNTILSFNASVATYNKHIRSFPNNIFVGNLKIMDTYPVDNYNKTLPSFNS